MAQVVPAGKVWLLKNIPWSNSYQHTKYFSNASAQHSWICDSSHIIGTENPKVGQNYIKDPLRGTIKLQARQETYLSTTSVCNYMCFQNTDISDGSGQQALYIYAFVTDIRFVSNSVAEFDYEVDVIQTFLMQGMCELKECYIERIHPTSDSFGAHLEPEPLHSDRYVYDHINYSTFYNADPSGWSVLMYASKARSEGDAIKSMGMRCGLPQGLYCNVFQGDETDNAYKKFSDWMNGLSAESFADWSEKIVAVVAVPSEFVTASSGGLSNSSAWNGSEYIDCYTSSIDGYTPNNKKLLTYPYNCHYMSTQDGSNEDLPYEFMTINNNGRARFKCALAIQPQPELIIAPYGYKGYPQGNVNYDAKIVVKDFPMIPWVGDAYKQYLGSQGMQNAFNILKGVAGGAITGMFTTGNPIGGLAGAGLGAVGSAIQNDISKERASLGSDAPHISSNSTMWALGQKTVMHAQKCICEEDARRIDKFFDCYGYASGQIAVPHLTNSRKNQNYVKTAGCTISGGAPASALNKIESIFNSGITVWSGTVGNYN